MFPKSRAAATSLVLAAAFALGGCATVFDGTTDIVTFESVPPGARVLVDGVDRGITPLTTSMSRSLGGATITYRLEGYETRTFELAQEFNITAVWNLLCLPGFWICAGIDVLSGAVVKYEPKTYQILLDPRQDLKEALEDDRVHRTPGSRP